MAVAAEVETIGRRVSLAQAPDLEEYVREAVSLKPEDQVYDEVLVFENHQYLAALVLSNIITDARLIERIPKQPNWNPYLMSREIGDQQYEHLMPFVGFYPLAYGRLQEVTESSIRLANTHLEAIRSNLRLPETPLAG